MSQKRQLTKPNKMYLVLFFFWVITFDAVSSLQRLAETAAKLGATTASFDDEEWHVEYLDNSTMLRMLDGFDNVIFFERSQPPSPVVVDRKKAAPAHSWSPASDHPLRPVPASARGFMLLAPSNTRATSSPVTTTMSCRFF